MKSGQWTDRHLPSAPAPDFVDLHTHVLPGLDDGPPSAPEALRLSRLIRRDGTRTVVATPHQLGRYAGNTAEVIRAAAEAFRRNLQSSGLGDDLRLLVGADVRIDEQLCERIDRGEILTLGDRGAYVLLEMPPQISLDLGDLLVDLKRRGITPILSHPERHPMVMRHRHRLAEWVRGGLGTQITAGSLIGEFGRGVQRAAGELVAAGMSHLVASDTHDPVHRPPRMQAAYRYVCGRFGRRTAETLFVINPGRVLKGLELAGLEPAERKRPRRWLVGRLMEATA